MVDAYMSIIWLLCHKSLPAIYLDFHTWIGMMMVWSNIKSYFQYFDKKTYRLIVCGVLKLLLYQTICACLIHKETVNH